MYSDGSHGTAMLTDIARNCVWPKLRMRLVLPPAPVAVAAAVAPNAEAAADSAVAVEPMSAARFHRSEPGTTSCAWMLGGKTNTGLVNAALMHDSLLWGKWSKRKGAIAVQTPSQK